LDKTNNYVNIYYENRTRSVVLPMTEGATYMQDIGIQDSNERRKYVRLPIELALEVEEVFKQDYVVIKDVGASVEVVNISRDGIGFLSMAGLPNGYYFNGTINFGGGDFFRVVIQILRSTDIGGNRKLYGAAFVGLAPFLADKVDEYQKKLNNQNHQEQTSQ
jgi:hypothetical protein